MQDSFTANVWFVIAEQLADAWRWWWKADVLALVEHCFSAKLRLSSLKLSSTWCSQFLCLWISMCHACINFVRHLAITFSCERFRFEYNKLIPRESAFPSAVAWTCCFQMYAVKFGAIITQAPSGMQDSMLTRLVFYVLTMNCARNVEICSSARDFDSSIIN